MSWRPPLRNAQGRRARAGRSRSSAATPGRRRRAWRRSSSWPGQCRCVHRHVHLSAVSDAASEAALNNNKLYWDTNALASQLTDARVAELHPLRPERGRFRRDVGLAITDVGGEGPEQGAEGSEGLGRSTRTRSTAPSIAKEQVEPAAEGRRHRCSGRTRYSAKAIDQTDSILRAKNASPDVWLNTGYIGGHQSDAADGARPGRSSRGRCGHRLGDTFETLDALGKEYPGRHPGRVLSARRHQPEIWARRGGLSRGLPARCSTATRSRRRTSRAYTGALVLFDAIAGGRVDGDREGACGGGGQDGQAARAATRTGSA